MGIFFVRQLILFNFKSEGIVLKLAKLSTGLIVVAIQSMICCLVGLTIIFILMSMWHFYSGLILHMILVYFMILIILTVN